MASSIKKFQTIPYNSKTQKMLCPSKYTIFSSSSKTVLIGADIPLAEFLRDIIGYAGHQCFGPNAHASSKKWPSITKQRDLLPVKDYRQLYK